MTLADMLIKKGVLKNQRLIEAFRLVDRAEFVPENLKDYAYVDEPLSIGEDQTISQPWTVAFMLELLNPQAGDNIMEIGYGSGWQTALLAATGANVYAIERIPELCKFGKENVEKFFEKWSNPPTRGDIISSGPPSLIPREWGENRDPISVREGRVTFFCQDGTLGIPEIAERIGGFDKIIVAAAAPTSRRSYIDSVPQAWKDQLKIGGKIVAPVGHSIFEFIKKPGGSFTEIEHPGFAFVPLVTDKT